MTSARDKRCSVAVLTVDDQPQFRGVAREVIAATDGFELVGEACSGEEALALARDVDPDLVLVDVRMPGMDGLETTRLLSAALPSATFVLVSTDEVGEHPCNACGASAFLPKKAFGPAALRRVWAEHGRTRRLPEAG
jgi:DNA-binding NarL/FixJ family response regulator